MEIIPDDLVSRMIRMGFTAYEAKTYLGLLQHYPATGYEVSKEAHVPRSVIYSVLRKLEAKGIVVHIHDKPRKYLPLSPKQLFSRLATDFSSRLESLKEQLTEFNNRPESEGFWNINGYDSLIQTCDALLQDSRKLICISGWKREIERLKPSLMAARKRGVEIIIFSFTAVQDDFGQVFSYGIPEEKLSHVWDRKLILVVDNRELVMGPANSEVDLQAIWTQNKAVLSIAINYIILDITLYGQRMHEDVSGTTEKLMLEKSDYLEELIRENLA